VARTRCGRPWMSRLASAVPGKKPRTEVFVSRQCPAGQDHISDVANSARRVVTKSLISRRLRADRTARSSTFLAEAKHLDLGESIEVSVAGQDRVDSMFTAQRDDHRVSHQPAPYLTLVYDRSEQFPMPGARA
jgi:hypothetical protein